jgi:hypothetical protein
MSCSLRRMAESVRSISEDAIWRPVRIRDAILTAGSNSMLETSDLPMFEEFQQTARTIFECAQKRGALTRNPDAARLRQMALAEPEVRQSKYGNIVADSEPTSRAARFTQNNIDSPFGKAEYDLLEQATRRLANEPLISLDVQVGDGSEGITARLIVPRRFAHVAYGGLKLFKPAWASEPICISHSTGTVTVFKSGEMIAEIHKAANGPTPQAAVAGLA